MHAKNLGAYLLRSDSINSLMPQAKRLLELRQVLLEALPDAMARNATVANYRQGKLVIFAANNAVAAKLKLMRPALGEHFSKTGLQVTVIDIQVQPRATALPKPGKHAVLTPSARQALAELSSELPDSKLKSAVFSILDRDVSDH